MTWHGYPGTFDDFVDLTWTDRWFANQALQDCIDISNEQGGGQPDDARK